MRSPERSIGWWLAHHHCRGLACARAAQLLFIRWCSLLFIRWCAHVLSFVLLGVHSEHLGFLYAVGKETERKIQQN